MSSRLKGWNPLPPGTASAVNDRLALTLPLGVLLYRVQLMLLPLRSPKSTLTLAPRKPAGRMTGQMSDSGSELVLMAPEDTW